MPRNGKCLCGAVRFSIRDLNPDFGVCHCKMCQRWAGSSYVSLTVPKDKISFEGDENIGRFQSSEWAERAWCTTCGTNLWYQVTAEGPYSGAYHVPVGLLDDTTGLRIEREFFVDKKIDALPLAGARNQFDTAAMLKMFGESE